ncbi:MAG TPA: TonB-dependent receptor [Acidobacteriota bacterium]|jgi:hypothetical protein
MKTFAAFAPSRLRRFYAPFLIFLFFFAAGGAFLFADTLTGQVSGNVFDVESHAPLSGVSVTLLNLDQGWKRQLQTDGGGNFVFMQLEPGHYSVAAEFTGYYRAERSDILIRLNQLQVVVPPIELRKLVFTRTEQITLRGEQTKTAIVDMTAPGATPVILAFLSEPGFTSLVSLLDWGVRFNFEDSLIQSLPLRGVRSFDQLALLSAGVFRVPFSTGQGPAVGIGVGTAGQFSVNGLRGRSNNFTVDGSDNNDEDIGVRRQGFVSLVPQSIESVQEFQIMTAGFPAEFGRNSASMVNAVSRSGKKDLHGSAYGMLNDDHLNARNFFEQPFTDQANGGTLNGGSFHGKKFAQAQAGGTLGAAIVPNKVFYFLSAEHQRHHGTAMAHFVVPAAGERGLRINPVVEGYSGFVPIDQLGGFLQAPDQFRDVRQGVTGARYSALAGRAVLALYPLPNNPSGPFGPNNYSQVRKTEGTGDAFSAKADWRLAEGLSFAARYNFTNDHSLIPFTSDAINSSLATATRTQNISLFLNGAGTRYGNAFRFSYGRTRLGFPPDRGDPLLFGSAPLPTGNADIDRNFQREIVTPYGRFGPFGASGPVGQLSILPYSTIGIDVFNFPQARVDNTFQLSDFITRSGPAHTLKFGADIRWSQLNSYSDRNSRPLLVFGYGRVSDDCQLNPFCLFATPDGLLRGLELAALGGAAGVLQTISTSNVADTAIGLRFAQYDLFAQDDWKPRKNLTVNFGLRYEYQTVPVEANRRIERTFGLDPAQFPHLQPSGDARNQQIIEGGNLAFDKALRSLNTLISGRTKIYQPDRNNFAPRAGLTWDPFGKGTTAIRAGYSLSYDANLGAVTSQSRNVAPTLVPVNFDPVFRPPDGLVINSPTFFFFVPTRDFLIVPGTLNSFNAPAGGFATALGAIFNQALPGLNEKSNSFAFTLPEKSLKTGYAQHFVLALERQLGRDLLVSAHYIGTRGVHLTRFTTPNGGMISTPRILVRPLPNSPIVLLTILDTSPSRAQRDESGLGAYTVIENSAASVYHSVQLTSEKRFSRGVQFRAYWTWSHSIDQVSDPFDGRGFYSLPQNGARLALERASANFDAQHRVAGYFLWEIPGSARPLLRSWKLAGTMEFQTGQPFTVNTAIDKNEDGNLTDRLNSLEGLVFRPGTARPIQLPSTVSALALTAPLKQDGKVGRNTFRGSGIATIDVSLSRRFALRDHASVDFRAEAFNLFNRTHFAIPVRILESPGFGRVFDTQVNPRSVRLTLKAMF